MPLDRPVVAGRVVPEVYRVSGRSDIQKFLGTAVSAAGGELIYISDPQRAPVYLGIRYKGERMGVLCYAFRCSPARIKGRAEDEHRIQIRYGSEESWHARLHALASDVPGIDSTLVVGVDVDREIFIGLDPALYDPLPMGISFEYKSQQVSSIEKSGWHVWERVNRPGRAREQARAREGLETVVGFKPRYLIRYIQFERQASDLAMDPPMRFVHAKRPPKQTAAAADDHELARLFDLTSAEILDIIKRRARLGIAVRGGVAEHHLQGSLDRSPAVTTADFLDEDGKPDFNVVLRTGKKLTVECKNVSPKLQANGDAKVEVQKTRASKGDRLSRYYRFDQFDVIAACMWPRTGKWEFRFLPTLMLEPLQQEASRIQPIQRVTGEWVSAFADVIPLLDQARRKADPR